MITARGRDGYTSLVWLAGGILAKDTDLEGVRRGMGVAAMSVVGSRFSGMSVMSLVHVFR